MSSWLTALYNIAISNTHLSVRKAGWKLWCRLWKLHHVTFGKHCTTMSLVCLILYYLPCLLVFNFRETQYKWFFISQVGPKKAREMWFLARFYTAEEAEKMGLVNTVVPVSLFVVYSMSLTKCLLLPLFSPYCHFTCFPIFQLEKLEQETIKWSREILRNSPTVIRVLKSALNAVDDGHAGLQVYSIHK